MTAVAEITRPAGTGGQETVRKTKTKGGKARPAGKSGAAGGGKAAKKKAK